MGAHNAAESIERAVRSIQEQTLADWELVVCDDGSTDATPDLLRDLARRDARIRLFRNERNRGLAASLNLCLREARAELCARQDADDVSLPHRLESQVRAFDEDPDLVLAGTAVRYVDEDGRRWGASSPRESVVARDLIRGACFAHVSVMYRRSPVLAAGGYDEGVGRAEDYDLWFRLVPAGRCRNLREPGVLVSWNRTTHARRDYIYRLHEARVRLRGYRRIGAPWYAYAYVLKPLLVGLAPTSWLWRYHAARRSREDGSRRG